MGASGGFHIEPGENCCWPSPPHSHSKPYTRFLYFCPQTRQIRGTSLQMILGANHFSPMPFLCRPAPEKMFRVGQADAQASEWSSRLGEVWHKLWGNFIVIRPIHHSWAPRRLRGLALQRNTSKSLISQGHQAGMEPSTQLEVVPELTNSTGWCCSVKRWQLADCKSSQSLFLLSNGKMRNFAQQK